MNRMVGRRALGACVLLTSALVGAVATAGPASAEVRDTSTFACPPGLTTPFADVAGTTHEQAIACALHYELTGGTSATTYSPGDPVSRGQMATFIARVIFGGVVPQDAEPAGFTDTAGTPHEASIDLIVELGIAQGTSSTTFSPSEPVSRAQMATFVLNTLQVVGFQAAGAPDDAFTDDDGNPHEGAIDQIASLGIAGGTSATTYTPGGDVSRGAMASFLVRVIDLAIEHAWLPPFAEEIAYAALTGAAEVPGPGDTDAVGTARVVTTDVPGVVCIEIDVADTDTVTAMHIHAGAVGVAGPPVVTIPVPDATGAFAGCVSDPDAEAIETDPDGHYVNVHTTAFPDGAVRGQLGTITTALGALLTPDKVVPGPGDADAIGDAFGLTTTQDDVLCMTVTVFADEPVTAVRVHEGDSGETGPEVLDFGPVDEFGLPLSCRVTDQASAIATDSAGYYLQVDTEAFPSGALRGQIGVILD